MIRESRGFEGFASTEAKAGPDDFSAEKSEGRIPINIKTK